MIFFFYFNLEYCPVCEFDKEVIDKAILFDRHDPCYQCEFQEECDEDKDFHLKNEKCEKYGKCTNKELLVMELDKLKEYNSERFKKLCSEHLAQIEKEWNNVKK